MLRVIFYVMQSYCGMHQRGDGAGETGGVITIISARRELRGNYKPRKHGARSGAAETTSCLYPVPPHMQAATCKALGLGKRQMESSPMGVPGVSHVWFRARLSRLVNPGSTHS